MFDTTPNPETPVYDDNTPNGEGLPYADEKEI